MAGQKNSDSEESGNLLQMLMDQAADLELVSTNGGTDPKDLIVDGFEISKLFAVIEYAFQNANDKEGLLEGLDMMNREQAVKAVNGTFLFEVISSGNKSKPVRYIVDMRHNGTIKRVPDGTDVKGLKPKPDVTLRVADKDMVALATGKMNPQMAFMKGRIKVKGNVMLGLRMQTVLMKEVAKMGRQSKL
ncbi:sterol-binding-like protein [Tilletiaria anomala UBC 951]|uniref:Sterol-binding-like protein n=1 Tax=Tilletiaria anomala (strain ATCC 24038 / CBS 436.72 / UBC 951) TaxID=1037660 RepID=A0A066VTA5_TILAU|nr:sterol-binding-like protein [Tilletiaria anomala UBC 951]KDN44937.1 sterol-binding-like protein [Tilletiaria anomala UBC 951]